MKKIIFCLAALAFAFNALAQWKITGNAGTNPAIHFLGTTDNQPLKFRINNQYAGEIDSATDKTFFGYGAGKNSVGPGNAAFGFKALNANTTGSFNTAVGFISLATNTTGFNNTAIGNRALFATTDGYNNTAIGYRSLYYNTSGNMNTANGVQSLYSNTSGIENTATGFQSLNANTTGYRNTATGSLTLFSNSTGYYNTANGSWALYYNTTGTNNTATGTEALYYNTTGTLNTATGIEALYSNTTGNYNTAQGNFSLYANTTGVDNTANGGYSLIRNTTGSGNTASGNYSLQSITTGSFNTALGYAAGNNSGTNPSNFTAIGKLAGHVRSNSNTVEIGNTSVVWIGGQTGWSTYSDEKIKDNIRSNVPGLSFITKLNPVTYKLNIHRQNEIVGIKDTADWEGKYDIEQMTQTGFLAQEVEQAAKDLNYEFSGVTAPTGNAKLYSLQYSAFVVPLVKAVQEQQQVIDELKKQNANLLTRITALEKRVTDDYPSNTNKAFHIRPNPSHDMVIADIIADNTSPGIIKIFDSKAALVKQQYLSLSAGINQVRIDIKSLANGTYYLSAEWNNGTVKQTAQLIKQ